MRRLTLVFLVVMALALAALATACGDDDVFGTTTAPSTTEGTEPTSSTTAPPTTTTAEPPSSSTSATSTTTTTTTSTTTTAPETVYLVDTTDFFPDPFPGSNDAHGSGCVTPGFDALPNGVWFGFAEGVGGGVITFDLACFFTGPAAVAAATADGEEAFDFYIRNKVATTFAVPIAGDARVWYIDMVSGDVTSPTEIPLASWPDPDSYQDCPDDYCSVWLYVNGGRVTGIVEQYLP